MPSSSAHLKAFALGIAGALVAVGAFTWWSSRAAAEQPVVTVYKSPTCGCCTDWVDHLRENGFAVQVEDVGNVQPVRERLGVPQQLASCHTAEVGGYVVEGHVPAAEVKRLLRERREVVGLAVPGMPVGSPGMEQGDRRDPYDVLAFKQDGRVGVYARYNR